ncbi:MAG: AzlC family ABC transporter permease [bacterium]|nr:AzlC family ABC transporter permease [bacterium]MDT8366399.1 AzlC family ABC transporter permease [bacterium]
MENTQRKNITLWSDVRLGFLHFLPVGVVIFGYALVFGVLAVNSGLTVAEACLMSLTIFAGASQFIALPMIQEGATTWALAAMALVVNLRHLLYGLNIGRKYPDANTWKLLGVSLGIVDETYAFNTIGPGGPIKSIPYFAGTAICSYIVWNVGTFAGALAGKAMAALSTPGTGELDFAMLAVFISMVGSSLRRRADWFVIGLSVVTALLVFTLAGGHWHLFAAGLLVPLAAATLFRESKNES